MSYMYMYMSAWFDCFVLCEMQTRFHFELIASLAQTCTFYPRASIILFSDNHVSIALSSIYTYWILVGSIWNHERSI